MNLGIKDLDKRRWVVLIAGCFINLCLGSIYVWSVFSAGMADYFTNTLGKTVTSADLAIVYTIANSVGPITMISGGWFNDKFGPRKVILIGGIMWGLGMFLSGFTTSVNGLILTYGLIGGLGLGMAYGSTISTCVKFFPDKRGLVGGITTAVYGLSSVILPPIVTVIVAKTNATTAFKIVGVVFMVLIAVSVLALFNALGRIVAGFVSDKIGRINTLFLACILAVIGLLCLYFSGMGTVTLFYIGLSIVGISYGAFMGVYPGFTADQFGPKNNSVNYGIMFIGFAIAGYFGPQIMGTTFAKTGAYQNAFMYAIVFSIVGIVFTFIYKLIAKKNK